MDANSQVSTDTNDSIGSVNVVPPSESAPKLPSKLNWNALLPVLALALALPFLANSIRQRQLTGSRAAFPNSYPCSQSYPCPTSEPISSPTPPCGNTYPCGPTATTSTPKTTPVLSYCSDSDGGLNYYVKGTVSSSACSQVQTDFCNGNVLQEQHCGAANNACLVTAFNCPNGCANGACLPSTSASPITPTPSIAIIPITAAPTPVQVNSSPRIVNRATLPVLLMAGRRYTTNIIGQDANRGDLLTMTASGLPQGLSFGPCVRNTSSSASMISCTIQGTPARAGIARSTIRLTDNRGGLDQMMILYTIIGKIPFFTDREVIPRLPRN